MFSLSAVSSLYADSESNGTCNRLESKDIPSTQSMTKYPRYENGSPFVAPKPFANLSESYMVIMSRGMLSYL
jgi:hypothetical protein